MTIQWKSAPLQTTRVTKHVKANFSLDVAEYPIITFKSTKGGGQGKDPATVTGDLTLPTARSGWAFFVKLNKAGPSPMDKSRQVAGFSALGK